VENEEPINAKHRTAKYIIETIRESFGTNALRYIDPREFMSRFLATALCYLFAWDVYAWNKGSAFEPLELTPSVASNYAIYSMIASNTYHQTDRIKFPVEKLGWRQVDAKGKLTDRPSVEMKSGLAYDIFESQHSNEVIFSFRGTDSKRDFITGNLAFPPFIGQYKAAKKAFGEFVEKHPDQRVVATGHSLGGSLALTMSVLYGVDAVVFDSSPRIFTEFRNKPAPAMRVMIYQSGEILAAVRKVWSHKFLKIVPQEYIYKASFDFGGDNKHRSDRLAQRLLELGATVSDDLLQVHEALPIWGQQ